MDDADVMRVLAVVMSETLDVGTGIIELLGQHMGVAMADVWQADVAMLDAVRDREVMGHLLVEVAGNQVAAENAKATSKVQRGIIRGCLTGTNGRRKRESWVPRWMAFPASAYTARGGVGSAERAARLAALCDEEEAGAEATEGAEAAPAEAEQALPQAA